MVAEVPVQGTYVSQVDLGRKLFFLVLSEEEVALVIHSNSSLITHLDVMKM